MHLKATLTIDMPSLTAIIKSHVEQAGYVLEDLLIEFDHTAADPVDIRCEVRPMSKEEAEAANIEVRSPEDQLRDLLDEYMGPAVDALKEHMSKVAGHAVYTVCTTVASNTSVSAQNPYESEDVHSTKPTISPREDAQAEHFEPEDKVPRTYLGTAAALSAEAAAKRKHRLRRQMKAEAAVLIDPIEAIEEYDND